MAKARVHIIGAGLSGLSAAVRLTRSGHPVTLYELAKFAGGRCRSLFEPALGMVIDNGNHLVLSGNKSAMDYLGVIGAGGLLQGPRDAEFPFADLATGARWIMRPNRGRIGWWIFSKARRVPGTRAQEYLSLVKLLTAKPHQTIGDVIPLSGPLYDKLLGPVLISALNTHPREASAALAAAVVRETLAEGGKATRPLVASGGLGPVFIDPALAWLKANGADIRFDTALRKIAFEGGKATALQFDESRVALGAGDRVILAVPGWVAKTLLPGLTVPETYRAIINAHFKVAPPAGTPALQGVINATTEWLFAFDNRLSVTISDGDRFIDAEREPLARQIWAEVAKLTGLGPDLPPWQIIKERRATFAATPAENARRPKAQTDFNNVILAGDWTATGLPATIEGSIRSGVTAAALAGKPAI